MNPPDHLIPNNRKSRVWKILLALALLPVVGIAGVVFIVCVYPLPFGLSSTYHARDHDPRLEREAASAKPFIAALEKYRQEHSTYPAQSSEIASYLSPSQAQAGHGLDEPTGWRYERHANGNGYTLTLRLGWDPDLVYRHDDTRAVWVFIPGDGTGEKVIILQ